MIGRTFGMIKDEEDEELVNIKLHSCSLKEHPALGEEAICK